MRLTKDQADKVYDILVEDGGAIDRYDERLGGYYDRNNFIYHHTKEKYPASEWRFQGHFGFGGKYYSGKNRVSCYPEDRTDERDELIRQMNIKLHEIIPNGFGIEYN